MSTTSTWHPSRGTLGMPDAPSERVARVAVPRRSIGARLLSILGIVAILGGAWWVTGSKIFQLRALRVSGNTHLSTAQVAALAGLTQSTNVFWLSSAGAERKLESNPWVASATVSRTLPSEVKVVIRERFAVAVVTGPSGLRVLVAGDGTILGKAGRGATLPVMAAPPSGAAIGGRIDPAAPGLAVAAALPASLRSRVSAIEVGTRGQVTLTLVGGGRVLFGDPTEAGAKAQALMAVLSWSDRQGILPASIDVRAPAAPALRPVNPSPGASPLA